MSNNRKSSMSSTKNWFDSNELFDNLFPDSNSTLMKRHWTPLEVAKKAAQFLAAEKMFES